jgi:hypothetical protein
MEQLNVFIKYIGCAGVTCIGIILLPFGVSICARDGKDHLGRVLAFFWVVEWIFVTVFLYNAIFG